MKLGADAYDVDAAAAKLGVSPWSIRELIRKKRLASFRVGKLVRVSQAALDRFIESGETARHAAS